MKNIEFRYQFMYGLLQYCFEYQKNNTDFLRFDSTFSYRLRRYIQDNIFSLCKKLGFVRRHFSMEKAINHLLTYIQNMDKLEYVYSFLGDEYSKSLFIELLLFRMMGAQHVKLSTNNKSFWEEYYAVDRKYLKKSHTIDAGKYVLNSYELDGESGAINLYGTSLGILNIFLMQQYAYQKDGRVIIVEPGDVAIDCGACWGDVSLYFADRVGLHGKVYAFEFVKDNLEVLYANLSQNKHISDRIDVVEEAVSSISEKTIECASRGPSSSIANLKGSHKNVEQTSTITIDDLAIGKRIPKVDFIKMDIERSELSALIGARKTIQKFKPKLAISIYHRNEDFFEIPMYIKNLNLGYEFYINHFSIHREETVLFAYSMR